MSLVTASKQSLKNLALTKGLKHTAFFRCGLYFMHLLYNKLLNTMEAKFKFLGFLYTARQDLSLITTDLISPSRQPIYECSVVL